MFIYCLLLHNWRVLESTSKKRKERDRDRKNSIYSLGNAGMFRVFMPLHKEKECSLYTYTNAKCTWAHIYENYLHFSSILQCLIVLFFFVCEQSEKTNQGRVRKETYFFYINWNIQTSTWSQFDKQTSTSYIHK